jgi:sulfatase maturation enzyme AslB (radical SAM superfamily)
MSWTTLRAAIDLLLAGGASEPALGFTGGEPLLALPLMRRAVEYLGERAPAWMAPRLHVTTNGTLLDREALRFLAARRARTIISFDGVQEAQRQRGEGTFARLEHILDELRAEFPAFLADDVTLAMTLTSANVPFLAESVAYFQDQRVPSFDAAPVETLDPGWGDSGFAELDHQLREVRALLRAEFRRSGKVPFLSRRPLPARRARDRDGALMCKIAGGDGVLVDVDGTVVTCAVVAPSYARRTTALARQAVAATRVGTVNDPDLPERLAAVRRDVARLALFTGKERKRSRYGECATCRERRDCLVCPMAIAQQPGNEDPDLIPPLPCAFNLLVGRHRRGFQAWLRKSM